MTRTAINTGDEKMLYQECKEWSVKINTLQSKSERLHLEVIQQIGKGNDPNHVIKCQDLFHLIEKMIKINIKQFKKRLSIHEQDLKYLKNSNWSAQRNLVLKEHQLLRKTLRRIEMELKTLRNDVLFLKK